jgi:pilus assembly protein CpaC
LRDLGYQTDILGGSGVETGFEIITGRSAQFLGNSAGLSQAQSTLIPGQPGLIAGAPLTSDFGGVVLNNSSLSQNLNLALSALVQEGAAQVLAEPNIVAMSGQQASFLVGGEFPVPVAQGGGGGGAGGGFAGALSVQYRQFGVGLEFTPSVLASNRINLQLTTEVSDLDLSSGTSVQGTTVPGLRTRRVSTTIELGDGNSFAIAGLLENNIGSLVNEFPGLGSLPIIGALFRSTQFTRDETELVIVVTPRLVSSVDANSISLPTDSFRPPSAFDQVIYGRTEAEPVSSGDSDGQTGEEPRLDGAQGHQF